jgi:hypothetical protein
MPYYDAERCRDDKSLVDRADFTAQHQSVEWTGMAARVANLAQACNGSACVARVDGVVQSALTDRKLNTAPVTLSANATTHTITLELQKLRYIYAIQVGMKGNAQTGVRFDMYVRDTGGRYQTCGQAASSTTGFMRGAICAPQALYGTAIMVNATFVNRITDYNIEEVLAWSACPDSMTRPPGCGLTPPTAAGSAGFPPGCLCRPKCSAGQGYNFTAGACTSCASNISVQDTQTGMCRCATGYSGITLEGGEPQCLDRSECVSNTHNCSKGYTCVNTVGSFTCVESDECAGGVHNCDTGYTCINTVGSFTCAESDECAEGTHNCGTGYTCNNTIGSFACTDNNECTENTHNCGTGYVCLNSAGSFACIDINECTAGIHNCRTGYVCANTVGGFSCANANECTANTHDCERGHRCIDTVGSFVCTNETLTQPQDPFFSSAAARAHGGATGPLCAMPMLLLLLAKTRNGY